MLLRKPAFTSYFEQDYSMYFNQKAKKDSTPLNR